MLWVVTLFSVVANVKVKLSLCLIKHDAMTCERRGVIAPRILNLGASVTQNGVTTQRTSA